MMNPEAIGIDIGGTNIKAAAFSSDGKLLDQWTRPTIDDPDRTVPGFAETVRDFLREISSDAASIGIAAPGVAAKDGRSIAFMSGKMHGIKGLDWTTFLERKKTVPVLNDAHAALLGEVWRGAAAGARDAILLTLGTGVGGAIFSDGRLLTGAMGRAGHIGHLSIRESEECSIVGIPGALELAIGNCTVAERSGGRFSSTHQLVTAQLAGDEFARKIWMQSVRDLARGIASLINIIDPECIIIGGGIAKAGDALFKPLREQLDEIEWQLGGHRVRIVPAQLGEWAGAYGAAWNAIKS